MDQLRVSDFAELDERDAALVSAAGKLAALSESAKMEREAASVASEVARQAGYAQGYSMGNHAAIEAQTEMKVEEANRLTATPTMAEVAEAFALAARAEIELAAATVRAEAVSVELAALRDTVAAANKDTGTATIEWSRHHGGPKHVEMRADLVIAQLRGQVAAKTEELQFASDMMGILLEYAEMDLPEQDRSGSDATKFIAYVRGTPRSEVQDELSTHYGEHGQEQEHAFRNAVDGAAIECAADETRDDGGNACSDAWRGCGGGGVETDWDAAAWVAPRAVRLHSLAPIAQKVTAAGRVLVYMTLGWVVGHCGASSCKRHFLPAPRRERISTVQIGPNVVHAVVPETNE